MWKAIYCYEPQPFVEQIELLVAELPSGNAIGLFERASARDSTGHPDLAVPLYRAALKAGLSGSRPPPAPDLALPLSRAAQKAGLSGSRPRRAIIKLASSLRNLGNGSEAADLLFTE